MSYDDFCEYGSNEFYSETFPKAAKPHPCCECGKKIPVGAIHLHARGKTEGEFWATRQCMDCRDFCMAIRDELMGTRSCLNFGGMGDFLSECSRKGFDEDTRKEKQKSRFRSYYAKWYWEREDRKVFWTPRAFVHREAERN